MARNYIFTNHFTVLTQTSRQLTLGKKLLRVTGCVFHIFDGRLSVQEALLTLPRPEALHAPRCRLSVQEALLTLPRPGALYAPGCPLSVQEALLTLPRPGALYAPGCPLSVQEATTYLAKTRSSVCSWMSPQCARGATYLAKTRSYICSWILPQCARGHYLPCQDQELCMLLDVPLVCKRPLLTLPRPGALYAPGCHLSVQQCGTKITCTEVRKNI